MPYSRLYYHFVWATKNRAEMIRESNREPLYAAIRAKVRDLGGMTHALNGLTEHVHLVATVPPAISLAEFIGQVKGSSSHLAGHLHAELFAWQLGYGVLTVSESHLPAVVHYVAGQQQRHAAHRLNPRLERASDDGAEGTG